ncbi:MAG: Holliday junction resolvase RuvX [Thermoleophilia bacterium]|jgi:putative Holliday junction resolvase
MKIIALDYGHAHTGVAICDPTGTIVRPLDAIDDASSATGLKKIVDLAREENAEALLVGMPVSLSGECGSQADETRDFIKQLEDVLELPLVSWDERFTSKMAVSKGHNTTSSSHSLAACVLLEDYLGSQAYRCLDDGDSD